MSEFIHLIDTAANSKTFIHVLFSTLTFSILVITALQALLLWTQDNFLRKKKRLMLLKILPPLEIMENLLFQMLRIGFVSLTILLVSSIWFFHATLTTLLWHKLIFTFLAWIIFLVLLLGRWLFGWRGQQAIIWTLSGTFVVILIYFGSEIF